MEEIKFYYEYEEDGYLSNYWPVEIIVENKTWKSVEHYYQAKKTLNKEYEEKIRSAETCDDAKKLGNHEDCPVREDWDEIKEIAMWNGIFAKFTQNEDLKKQLLETGDAVLIENSQKDYYWGLGADGSGKSRLGVLLMKLRTFIRG